MEVKLEINLQDLCIISIADSLWNEEEIINKTKTYLCSPSRYKKNRMWDVITKEVISLINEDSLPEFLYTELVLAVDNLGKKKRDFFTYCKRQKIFQNVSREQLYENYLKKIYWSHCGTVDVEKVVKTWKDNPNCDLWKVYVMASCYCSEEFIWEVWSEVKKTHPVEDFEKLYGDFEWHMAAFWDSYFNDSNDLKFFIEDVRDKIWGAYLYNPTESAEKNIFKLAVGKGYKHVAKNFFWYLSEKEREENFLECFNLSLRHLNSDDDDDDRPIKTKRVATYFRDDQSVEIFLFLLSCFDLNDRALIQDDYESASWCDYIDFNDVMEFNTRWPWIKLIVPFVNNNKQYLSYDNYKKLFDCIIDKQHHNCFPASMANVYQMELLKLWEMLRLDEKENLSKGIVSKLFSVWDVVSLKKILNDKDMCPMKPELLAEGLQKLGTFVEDDNQEMIKKFMDLLITSKWEKSIQLKMEMVYQHILKCEFDSADKVFNSFCRSKEEINSFKNTIDSYVICCYFIKRQEFHFADQFLLWKLNSMELADYFKLNFIYHPFSVHHILKLWDTKKENAQEARFQVNKFLVWFLKSEESIINFITSRFSKTAELKKFVENSEHGHYEIIDELLSWCLMKKKEIKSFKNNFLSKKEDLMAKIGYYMREYKWDAAQELLNWKFDSQTEKDTFLKKFFKSKRWALDCTLFLFNSYSWNMFGPQPSQDEMAEKVDEFIELWMKPPSKKKTKYTKAHLKNFLMKWPEESFQMLEENEESSSSRSYNDEFDPDGSDYESDNEFEYHEDAGHIEIFMEELSHYYPDVYYFFDSDDLNFSDSSDDYRYYYFYGSDMF